MDVHTDYVHIALCNATQCSVMYRTQPSETGRTYSVCMYVLYIQGRGETLSPQFRSIRLMVEQSIPLRPYPVRSPKQRTSCTHMLYGGAWSLRLHRGLPYHRKRGGERRGKGTNQGWATTRASFACGCLISRIGCRSTVH